MMNPKKLSHLVEERRMRSIYELLDSGNNKKALSDIDRMLKKTPKNTLAKVVRALTLIRLRREDEALAIIEEVVPDAEVSGLIVGDVSQILLNCYKELNQPQMMCIILEHLCANQSSEELLTHYFMALLRVQEYRKMHQTAMRLFKTYQKAAYFSWAIASLFLHNEFFTGPLDQQDTLSFQLGERMIDKFLMDETRKDPEFQDTHNLLDLYIRLMIRSSTNWVKMLNILKHKGYPPQDISSWTWSGDHEKYCYIMEQGGYQLELLKYLRDLFMVHEDPAILKQIVNIFGNDEAFRSKAIELMDDLRENHGSFVVALGNLYFSAKVEERYPKDERKEKIEEDLQMAVQFGMDKQNFFPDAVDNLKLVDHKAQRELVGIMASESIEDVNAKITRVQLIKDINYELARRDVMGKVFDLHQRIKQANFCFGKYLHLKISKDESVIGEGAPRDDVEYLDQYVLVAASILLSEHYKLSKKNGPVEDLGKLFGRLISTTTGEKSGSGKGKKSKEEEELLILSAMCLLEYCLARSPQNNTVRLILGNAYARVGATVEMMRVMQEINIKNIQLESLGYVMYPIALTTGTYADALMMLRQADQMYATYENDNIDFVIAAFQNCSFQQATDFSLFRDQLLMSTQCGIVLVEKRLLEFSVFVDSMEMLKIHAGHTRHELNLAEMGDIICSDNRDLSIMYNLFDDEMDWKEFQKATINVDSKWYKMRLCLLRIMSKMISLSVNTDTPEVFAYDDLTDLKNLGTMLEELCAHWEDVIKIDSKLESPFYGVYPPRYFRFFELSIHKHLVKQVNCVIKIMMENHPAAAIGHLKMFQGTINEDAQNLLDLLEGNWTAFQTNPLSKNVESCIKDFHYVLESFAFSKVFLAVVISTTRMAQFQEPKKKGNAKKGKQGKEFAAVIKDILDYFQKLHKLFCEFINFLKNQPLPTWQSTKSSDGDPKAILETNFLTEAFPTTLLTVQKNIRHSHLDQLLAMAKTVEAIMQFIRNI